MREKENSKRMTMIWTVNLTGQAAAQPWEDSIVLYHFSVCVREPHCFPCVKIQSLWEFHFFLAERKLRNPEDEHVFTPKPTTNVLGSNCSQWWTKTSTCTTIIHPGVQNIHLGLTYCIHLLIIIPIHVACIFSWKLLRGRIGSLLAMIHQPWHKL